jgi:ubiquitin carboxyl-terminal hydrolase 7
LDAVEKKMIATKETEPVVTKLFEGKTLNYIRCIEVDFESKRYESFLEVQLSVKGMSSIYEALDCYFTEELMDEDNKYDAGDYGKQIANKGIKIMFLPPILMMQLKRFEFDFQRERMDKISDLCEFYDEINMAKYVVKENKQETEYKLFSVLVHSGSSTTSGHYYSFIRPKMSKDTSAGLWYKFNDDKVEIADVQEVFEANYGGWHIESKLNKGIF